MHWQPAWRPRQAIGRVIRHEHDYGAILLLDDRFVDADGSMSAWLRPAIWRPPSFGAAISKLAQVRGWPFDAVRDTRCHYPPFAPQFFKENAIRHAHVVQMAHHRKSVDGAIQRETELLQQQISAAAAEVVVDETAPPRGTRGAGAAHSLHEERGPGAASWAVSRPPGISAELLQMAVAHRSAGAIVARPRGDGSGVASIAASASGGSGGLLGLLGGAGSSRRSSASAADGAGGELAALFGRASSRHDSTVSAAVPVQGNAGSGSTFGRPWLQSRPSDSGGSAPATFGLGGSRPISRPVASEPRPSFAAVSAVARPAAPAPSPPPPPLPPLAAPASGGKVAQAQAVLESAQALCNAAHGGAEVGHSGAAAYTSLRDALKTLVTALAAGGSGTITPVEASLALGSFIQVATAALGLRPHSSPDPTGAAVPALTCLHNLGRFVHAAHRRTYREVVVMHGFPYTPDPSEPPHAAAAATASCAAGASGGGAGVSGAKRFRDATS